MPQFTDPWSFLAAVHDANSDDSSPFRHYMGMNPGLAVQQGRMNHHLAPAQPAPPPALPQAPMQKFYQPTDYMPWVNQAPMLPGLLNLQSWQPQQFGPSWGNQGAGQGLLNTIYGQPRGPAPSNPAPQPPMANFVRG